MTNGSFHLSKESKFSIGSLPIEVGPGDMSDAVKSDFMFRERASNSLDRPIAMPAFTRPFSHVADGRADVSWRDPLERSQPVHLPMKGGPFFGEAADEGERCWKCIFIEQVDQVTIGNSQPRVT